MLSNNVKRFKYNKKVYSVGLSQVEQNGRAVLVLSNHTEGTLYYAWLDKKELTIQMPMDPELEKINFTSFTKDHTFYKAVRSLTTAIWKELPKSIQDFSRPYTEDDCSKHQSIEDEVF
jgi:hypothetical protein